MASTADLSAGDEKTDGILRSSGDAAWQYRQCSGFSLSFSNISKRPLQAEHSKR